MSKHLVSPQDSTHAIPGSGPHFNQNFPLRFAVDYMIRRVTNV